MDARKLKKEMLENYRVKSKKGFKVEKVTLPDSDPDVRRINEVKKLIKIFFK